MGIKLISNIEQANGQDFYLVDSNDVRGGMYYCDNSDDLNLIPSDRLRNGLLCYIEEDDKYYKFKDNEWKEFSSGSGGDSGGGIVFGYISSRNPETMTVSIGQKLDLQLDFSSPNIGRGTLKVVINDVESLSTSLTQGETITTIDGKLFQKGTNKMVVYVIDRAGALTNSLIFTVRYGGTEIVSTFDAYTSYDYGSSIRYYFTPTALDTSQLLKFYMKIDGTLQEEVSCKSDVRSYFTFPRLEVGKHSCEAWVEDNIGGKSNILTFNLIILDENSLVVASDTSSVTLEEGAQLTLDYKAYMKNNSSFITKVYLDDKLINTGFCGLSTAYYKTTSLKQGAHIVKVEVWDVTETVHDYIIWNINVTESTYEMKEPIKTGATFIGTAKNKTNSDENREIWIGHTQDNTQITANLYNFAFNDESGWMDNKLYITGNSYVEIPIKPLSKNARYGFTLDIEFMTKSIGIEDSEVLSLWDSVNNCGIKITTEEVILRSKSGNACRLYFTENEIVNVIFIIDREEKTAKICLNGVICEAFALSDYVANGVSYLEDFTVNENIYLGGKNKSGYCAIKNLRVYEVALATEELLNNFISNETDKVKQKELVEFQKGDNLPTLTVYCDFSGIGKDDKKPCNITYLSPDVTKYGESFTLTNKTSSIQYQGTSSMQYPIKNYRINLRDKTGDKWKYNPFKDGQPESRFTLKADFMSSGHWQNTGLAKWINDNLYKYNTSDEKSMNPFKWYSIQNGGKLSDTRETINGFPCRLILVNDGESQLNEGQEEPTPGNTKDMGIFNFNNDKDNTGTFGFNTDIFPNCMSFEVVANSDTSAGAFVSYKDISGELEYYQDSFELRYPDADEVGGDYGYLNLNGDENYGLKRLVEFVDKSSDSDFKNNFEQYFLKDYVFRYYILVIVLGMVDNLGKNMMLDTADGQIWFPRFYDMD